DLLKKTMVAKAANPLNSSYGPRQDTGLLWESEQRKMRRKQSSDCSTNSPQTRKDVDATSPRRLGLLPETLPRQDTTLKKSALEQKQ
ncbi:hypothetical protein P7K49_018626, partial [Saguinus oedipus]